MVPKRKTSKAVKRARRSHLALRPVNLESCPRCGTARRPHHACMSCGYVNGKVALDLSKDEE